MAQDIRAIASDVGISAQKVRLVIDLVRGKDVAEALNILKFEPSLAAKPVSKLVASAVANAQIKGIDGEDLYIHTITADEARTRKWRRFGARGRFKPWLRRASHVTVILRERAAQPASVPAAKN